MAESRGFESNSGYQLSTSIIFVLFVLDREADRRKGLREPKGPRDRKDRKGRKEVREGLARLLEVAIVDIKSCFLMCFCTTSCFLVYIHLL